MSDIAGPTVLYVEDEPLIRALGIETLEEAGFSVVAVASGREALAAIDTQGDAFRALVTDIDLGSMPSGWDVAKHARERFPDFPIIYVSGGSSADWTSMGVPGSTMLVKPYASAQLIVALSSATLGPDLTTNS